jgi:glycosyltransferase involved in cell wall biosynthesis
MNPDRLHILLFIYSLSSGGAERVTVNLANYWAERARKVTIATLASSDQDFYELHPGVRRIAIEMECESRNPLAGLWMNLRRITALRRVIKKESPDVVLAMMTTANVLLALAGYGLHVALLGSERVHPPRYPLSRSWEWLRIRAYARLATVVTQTNETAGWISGNTRTRSVAVIPNGVSYPLAVQTPVLEPGQILPAGQRVILGLGRLVHQKGFDLLIDAFSGLASRYPEWILVILGEGPERQSLEAQIRRTGLTKRVFMPGRAGNPGQWYEAADIYVMSSRFEGFPNTLVEAMAYGLPAISFDCDTGPRDIIRHATDGLLVPTGDEQGLVASLERLMSDDVRRRQLGERATYVRDRFSMDRVAGMWDNTFLEVLE